ncbi:glycosyltransferase, partial [Candidatus Sumerlaeota bacterium]|nr:glycosyltransferase [Candidatus Sumerlaeota bacterium]
MQPLSIIILTRNRLAKLKVCLEKLLPQLAESDEIILIDTGSTDGTVEEFGPGADLSKAAGRDSRVQFHKFASEGSWAEARNLGVGHAVNSIIAFLDDDCYAAPDWIARGRAAMEEKGPAPCDAAGGLVLPHGIRDWPDWWDARMGWLVGISVPGHLTPAAGAHYYPYTSNLWARAELLRAEPFQELGGEFAEEEKERYQLGREDAEWWRRIRVKGYRTRFDAALRVEHHIEPERLTQDYLFARARRDGEAWARREGGRGDLEPIAYQWWRNAFPARGDAPEPAPPAGTEPPSPDRNPNSILYHQMMAARYRVAVKTLARKVAVGDHAGHSPTRIELRARLGAARRIIFDRSKTIARRAALAFSPPAVWVVPKERPSTLAIAAFGHVGDMVILQSFLRGFIEAYPNLPAAIIAPPSAESIFRTSPKVNLTVLSGPSSSSGEPREILHQWILKVRPRLIFAPYLHEPWGSAFVRLVHSIRQPEIPIIGFDQDTGLARRLDQERIALRIHKVMQEHESRNLERLVAGEISSPGGAPRFEFPEF